MTKLKVKAEFIDRITNELRKVDDVIEVEEARAKELLADERHLVEEIKEEKKAKAKKTADSEEE